MFAALVDMEPGMWFRPHAGSVPVRWLGVEHVVSRFAGKARVRVLCTPGPSFVADRTARFELIDWNGG